MAKRAKKVRQVTPAKQPKRDDLPNLIDDDDEDSGIELDDDSAAAVNDFIAEAAKHITGKPKAPAKNVVAATTNASKQPTQKVKVPKGRKPRAANPADLSEEIAPPPEDPRIAALTEELNALRASQQGMIPEADAVKQLQSIKGGSQGLAGAKSLQDAVAALSEGTQKTAKVEPAFAPQLLARLAAMLPKGAKPSLRNTILNIKNNADLGRSLGALHSEGHINAPDFEELIQHVPSEGSETAGAGAMENLLATFAAQKKRRTDSVAANKAEADAELAAGPTGPAEPEGPPPEEGPATAAEGLFAVGAPRPGKAGRRLLKTTVTAAGRKFKPHLKGLAGTAASFAMWELVSRLLSPRSEKPETLAANDAVFQREQLQRAGDSMSTETALEDLRNQKANMTRMAMMGQVNPRVYQLMKTLQPGTLTKNERSYIPDPALATLAGGGLQALVGNAR